MNIRTDCRNVNTLQYIAVFESIFTNRLHAGRYLDTLNTAIGESTLIERNHRTIIFKGNFFHWGSVAKGISANKCYRSREVEFFQLNLVSKGTVSDGFQLTAAQEIKVSQFVACCKCIFYNTFKLRPIGNIHRFQICASVKCTA